MGSRVGSRLYAVALLALSTAILTSVLVAEPGNADGPFDPANPPPEPFEDFAFRQPEMVPTSNDLPSGTDVEHFDAVVDADGAVHAVWQETMDGMGSIFYAKRWPGRAVFDPAQRLSKANWNSTEPRIDISGNGTIHVIWINRTTSQLIMAISIPDSGGWRINQIYQSGWMECPSIQVLSDGTVILTYVSYGTLLDEGKILRTAEVELIFYNETCGVWYYKLILFSHRSKIIEYVRAILTVSPAGNPHVVIESQGYIYWMRSLDGGRTWSEPVNWFDGPVEPVEFTAEALADERIAIACSKRPHDHLPSWPFHRCGHYLSLLVSDPAGMSSTKNLTRRDIETLNSLPAAFDVQPFEGGVWLAFLGFPKEKAGETNLDGSLTPRLYAYLLRTDGTTAGPLEVADIPGRPELDPDLVEERLDDSVVSLDLEVDGRPLVAAATPLRSDRPIRGYVWRVNHAPTFPLPMSETQGGWILDNPFDLQVEPSVDIDGDDLVYEFLIVYRWGSFFTGQFTKNTAYAQFHLPGNGDYCWTVRISDPWVRVETDEDWWFRFDIAPPRADAGGPYVYDEGGTLLIDGGRSTDERPLALWEWDMDGDGAFELSFDSPTFEHTALDDVVTRITLRVTDVAGRTDIDHSQLVVWNVPPVAILTGPSSIAFDTEAVFKVEIIDNGTDDTQAVTWLVDGRRVGQGIEIAHVFDTIGVHTVSARVVDDDGGLCIVEMEVEVIWVDAPYVIIAVPDEVMQGELFRVHVSQYDLNPFIEWEFEWTLEGETVSDEMEAWCRVDEPSEVTIEFTAESYEGEKLVKERTVVVLELLSPVDLVGVIQLGADHMVIEWTRCGQDGMFEGYEIVVSNRPVVPWDPNGSSDPPSQFFLRFSIEDIDTISYNVTELEENTTYYVYIDVVGNGQRAHSNVHSAMTLKEQLSPQPQPQPPDDDDEVASPRVSPAQVLGLILLAIVMTFVSTYVYMKKRG